MTQFMKQQIELDTVWIIATVNGTVCIPNEVQPFDGIAVNDDDSINPEFEETFQDYIDGNIEGAHKSQGWIWRLSAPGYLDCTEWSLPVKSVYLAIQEIIEENEEYSLRELLDSDSDIDVDEMIDSYFLTMAFTGSRETPNPKGEQDYNSKPLVSHGGQDISEVCDGDMVRDWLTDEQVNELTGYMLDFALSACIAMCDVAGGQSDWIESVDWEQFASDFHFTRNGHGAGFWDGDWQDIDGHDFGNLLSDLSKPYGTCELNCFGYHIDDDYLQDNYSGSDADLETSLFEYHLVWANEPDSNGEIRFYYPSTIENDVPTHFNWGNLKLMTTESEFKAEFNWVDDWESILNFVGADSFESWLKGGFGQKISDVVSYWGTENVFGTDYNRGNPIHTDDKMTCDIQN